MRSFAHLFAFIRAKYCEGPREYPPPPSHLRGAFTSDFGAHARHHVVVRPLLRRHHSCELEIPLHPAHRLLNRDYIEFDRRRLAFSEAGSS